MLYRSSFLLSWWVFAVPLLIFLQVTARCFFISIPIQLASRMQCSTIRSLGVSRQIFLLHRVVCYLEVDVDVYVVRGGGAHQANIPCHAAYSKDIALESFLLAGGRLIHWSTMLAKSEDSSQG